MLEQKHPQFILLFLQCCQPSGHQKLRLNQWHWQHTLSSGCPGNHCSPSSNLVWTGFRNVDVPSRFPSTWLGTRYKALLVLWRWQYKLRVSKHGVKGQWWNFVLQGRQNTADSKEKALVMSLLEYVKQSKRGQCEGSRSHCGVTRLFLIVRARVDAAAPVAALGCTTH